MDVSLAAALIPMIPLSLTWMILLTTHVAHNREHWLGELMPPFSESPPWLLSLLPTTDRPRTVLLLSAAMLDAFMFAHNCRRHQISSASVSQQIHARMRATARRHRPVAEAWRLERRVRLLFDAPV